MFGRTIKWLLDMKQQCVNEISDRRFSRMGKNYISTVRRSSALYTETYCIKTLSGESVFIRSLQ